MRKVLGLGLAGLVSIVVAGVSVSLAAPPLVLDRALLPDVVEEVPSHLTIQNTQQREWLRFTTVHINVGSGQPPDSRRRPGGALRHRRDPLRPVHRRDPGDPQRLRARSSRRSPPASRCSTPSTTTGTSPPSREFAVRETIGRPADLGGREDHVLLRRRRVHRRDGLRQEGAAADVLRVQRRSPGPRLRAGPTATTSRRRCRSSTSPASRRATTT